MQTRSRLATLSTSFASPSRRSTRASRRWCAMAVVEAVAVGAADVAVAVEVIMVEVVCSSFSPTKQTSAQYTDNCR